jgi:hypothetical protein
MKDYRYISILNSRYKTDSNMNYINLVRETIATEEQNEYGRIVLHIDSATRNREETHAVFIMRKPMLRGVFLNIR